MRNCLQPQATERFLLLSLLAPTKRPLGGSTAEGEVVNPVQSGSFVPLAEGADSYFVLSSEDAPNVEELEIEPSP
jgi:hypothetical protein